MVVKKKTPLATNYAAAATILGYSVGFLKQLRDAGCDGFHHSGRIDPEQVAAWVTTNPGKVPTVSAWRDSLGTEKLRAQKRENDLADGLLVRKSLVAEQFQKTFRPALARVEQMLINEYPSKVAGLDVPAARVYGKRVLDMILEAHREAAAQWQT